MSAKVEAGEDLSEPVVQFLRKMAPLQIRRREQSGAQFEAIRDIDRVAQLRGSAVEFDRRRQKFDVDNGSASCAMAPGSGLVGRRAVGGLTIRVGRGIRDQLGRRHREKLGLAIPIPPDRFVVDHEDPAAVRLGNPERRRIGLEQPFVPLGNTGQSFEVESALREQRGEHQTRQREQGDEAPLQADACERALARKRAQAQIDAAGGDQ